MEKRKERNNLMKHFSGNFAMFFFLYCDEKKKDINGTSRCFLRDRGDFGVREPPVD